MKEGFDKEIDSLLRRRAGGAVTSFADGDGALASASSHLDADELGAFAEGALPSPARLAAASHLADCDRCRGVVVALTRALGGGAEVKQAAAAIPASAAAKKPASWGTWVATLFSPRVLRYAAPVLALSVVAVVSFVALRTRNSGALNDAMSARPQMEVAQTQPGSANPATVGTAANANQAGLVAQNPKDPSANQDSTGTTARQSPEGRGPNVGEAVSVTSEAPGAVTSAPAPAEDAPAAPPPSPVATTTETSPEIAKAAPRPAVEESEVASKSDAKSEGSDKQKKARESEPSDEAAANDLARGRAAQNRAGEVQMPDGGSRNQKRDGNVSNIYGGNAGASAAQPKESEREDRSAGGGTNASRRAPASRRGEQRQAMDETTRAGETREAAGHRFRREGSTWFDVKYKSSMSSMGVKRGTENFRALVADFPVIGRVAEQIPGEVIVVINGRAYRIH